MRKSVKMYVWYSFTKKTIDRNWMKIHANYTQRATLRVMLVIYKFVI